MVAGRRREQHARGHGGGGGGNGAHFVTLEAGRRLLPLEGHDQVLLHFASTPS